MDEKAVTSRRRGRPPAAQSRLSRERIVEEARRIVEASGFDGLSARKLAAALGVDPMAIYHHLPNKEAVIRAVVEEAFGAMPLPDRSAGWRERVGAWARAYCGLAARYPGLVLRVPQDPTAVSAAMEVVSAALVDAFVDGGLTRGAAEGAAGVLVDFLNGFLLAGAPAGPELEAHLQLGLDMVCAGAAALGREAGSPDA